MAHLLDKGESPITAEEICAELGIDVARFRSDVEIQIALKAPCRETWAFPEGDEPSAAYGVVVKTGARYWLPGRFPESTDQRWYRDITFEPKPGALDRARAAILFALRNTDVVELARAIKKEEAA